MAIYHCSIKIISRGKGKSAVAAAAYRAGEKITNEYDGITHDYTRKSGVVFTEILLPEYAPEKYTNRTVLWNAVEKIEKAKNSQLAREIELALPVEFTREQNISLVHEYVTNNFVTVGMCADICIHDKNDGNPHAHILLTMRPFEKNSEWGIKAHKVNGQKIPAVDWNEQTKAEEWRACWAESVNAVLERHGVSERVDHRSYKRQGIEQIPTVHLGVSASQMEHKGIVTERGNVNREIKSANNMLQQFLIKITQFKDWLKQTISPAKPTMLIDSLREILQGGEKRIRNLKMAELVCNFMHENNISTLPELREKVSEIQDQCDSTHYKVKYLEQRIHTLDEHIWHSEIYLKHLDIYNEYRQLKSRKQPRFFEAHRAKLMLFEAAKQHFKKYAVEPNIPIKEWKDEREKLITEKGKAYREYNALKAQFEKTYTVNREAEQIVREINQLAPKRDVRKTELQR